jgi:hypothetical protein
VDGDVDRLVVVAGVEDELLLQVERVTSERHLGSRLQHGMAGWQRWMIIYANLISEFVHLFPYQRRRRLHVLVGVILAANFFWPVNGQNDFWPK